MHCTFALAFTLVPLNPIPKQRLLCKIEKEQSQIGVLPQVAIKPDIANFDRSVLPQDAFETLSVKVEWWQPGELPVSKISLPFANPLEAKAEVVPDLVELTSS